MSILVLHVADEPDWRKKVVEELTALAELQEIHLRYSLRGDWRAGEARSVKVETPTYREAFLIASRFVRGMITQD